VSDHVVFPRTATGSYPGGRFPHPPDKAYLEPPSHVLLEFRRDDLKRMIEILDLVAGTIRPAVDRA
jgi:hypothetical protein